MTKTALPTAIAASALLLVSAAGCSTADPGTTGQPDAVVTGDAGHDAGGDATPDAPVEDTEPSQDADAQTTPDTASPDELCNVVTLVDAQPIEVVAGKSGLVEFDVPDNAVSVAVSVNGAIADAVYFGIESWTHPGGSLVPAGWQADPDNQGGICMTCDLRVAPSQVAFAALAPNNPNATFEPGAHAVRVSGYTISGGGFGGQAVAANASATVTVHAKLRPDGLPASGVLDVNLHFTGAQGWTADNAPTNPDVVETIDKVRDIYAQVGVSLGHITYTDIDSKFQVIESFDGADSDLMEMFSSYGGADPTALDVYFVDELKGPFGDFGFGVVLGIAGGIPGPPGFHDTGRSGVAIAIKPVQGAPAGHETTMAHEMGHFLGLFHTAEQAFFGPQTFDPLPDTPDVDDNTWLMHNQGSGTKMSEWQGIVMRSNPWICLEEAN